MTRNAALFLILLLIAAAGVGCGGDGVTCAAGTVEKGGACVAVGGPTCGAGTTLDGGVCVALGGADGGEDATSDTGGGGSDVVAPDADAKVDATDDAGSDAVDAAADVTTCVPVCVGKSCGGDGCGGSCGTCKGAEKPFCDAAIGQCVAVCVPDCVSKNCGSDGCGGTCGACKTGEVCEDIDRCVPTAWTCDKDAYAYGSLCDCGCGVPDPDCAKPGAILSGCGAAQKCSAEGICVSKAPKEWTCAASSYQGLDACDCGCGAPDPDCAFDQLPVAGCPGFGATCSAAGACIACTPACTGKQCGSDGCGGVCGLCTAVGASACDAGTCVHPCLPTPIKCKGSQCGDDGCGGSCGSCGAGTECKSGLCVAKVGPVDPASCLGLCGSKAPGGCSCVPGCDKLGTCCPDFDAACKCTPNCAGKQCGSDGCGGTCGACGGDKPTCDAKQQCVAGTCAPKCKDVACGDDGCGGTCGTCGAGSACAWTQQCVPSAWFCDASYYADKAACDCGCGAADPDCKATGTSVYGCPAGVSCAATGLCAMDLCTSNAACPGKWCTGVFYKGSTKFAGVCDNPEPKGLAPGKPCTFDLQCASRACLGGTCRLHCTQDTDCPPTQSCLGTPVAADGKVVGFASVCAYVEGTTTVCKSQAECKANNELCVAHIDPITLGPKLLCTDLGGASYGASCASGPCPSGHLCAIAKQKFLCTLPCPAGDVDCPVGWMCGQTTLHNGGTPGLADDPKVAVCIPK